MTAVRGAKTAPQWVPVEVGTAAVGAAERAALGTAARVAIWPPHHLAPALAAVDTELALLDGQASRFRDDSEVSAACRRGGAAPGGGGCIVSEGLAEAIAVALAAAEWTGGLVDPTVGGALSGLGYDRDFAAVPPDGDASPAQAHVPGWRAVRLDGRRLRLPAGTRLDLGATAKGLGSDRAARAAAAAVPGGGVLVSLGGDIAVAGEAPHGGWPVLVADEPGPAGRPPSPAAHPAAGQLVRLAAGALATSSILCRQWRRGGRLLHHIVDPRTGLPAAGPWRTVSVAAATCAEANAAATAAIIAGDRAPEWLAGHGLPARLAGRDGGVTLAGGWPAADGGVLEPPRACRMPPGPGPDGRPPGSLFAVPDRGPLAGARTTAGARPTAAGRRQAAGRSPGAPGWL